MPKNQGSLGFSIIGGTDHSCTPFGAHEPGIFISHVSPSHLFVSFFLIEETLQIVPGGIAELSGKLRMGDRILKVNGTDVTQATHQEAVMELLRPCDDINLTVQHDPLPAGFQVKIYFLTYIKILLFGLFFVSLFNKIQKKS